MNIFSFFLLLCFILCMYITIKKHGSNLLITMLCTFIIIYIIVNPKDCINYTISGTKLFFYSVFPSLFPFLILINIIISCGGINVYSKLFGNVICKPLGLPKTCSLAIIISLFCGYPLGAKYSSDLHEKNLINFKTYERLLNIASNGSPLFIIGAVGTSMLSNSKLGYILLLSNCLSCIVMGLILPNKFRLKDYKPYVNSNQSKSNINLGLSFKNAIEDSIKTVLSIGGFIIIFSVFINIIKDNALFSIATENISNFFNIPSEIIKGLSLGMIELTNGCSIICTSNLSTSIKLIILSFLIGFSGISITSQVYSMIYKFKINMKKYLFLKTIQGIISSVITAILCNVSILNFSSLETFSPSINYNTTASHLYIITILIIILPFIISLKRKLSKLS
ncbi:sporulation integral membrane protein YlbJ [Clostridium ihumii]